MSSEPFWYQEPGVLFSKAKWYIFVPQPNMGVREALNAVVRFSIYLSVLLFIAVKDPWYLLFIPLVMFTTVFLDKWFPQAKKLSEGFTSGPVVTSYQGTSESMPDPDNPFMNPKLTEIQSGSQRPPAADVTRLDVRDEVNAAFAQTSNIYMDTTDVFDLVQSQRNFWTVPENDYGGFLNFLGKNAQYSNQKLLSEGYVVAKGTSAEFPAPAVSTPPAGTAPATNA